MAEPSPSTKGAPSVLIVDDHELVGTSLAVALTAEGLRARRAAAVDLVGVLKEVASLPPGLALLDLDLGRDRQGRRRDGVDLVVPLIEQGWSCLVLSAAERAGSARRWTPARSRRCPSARPGRCCWPTSRRRCCRR